MSDKRLSLIATLLGLVALAGFLGLDRGIAETVSRHPVWPGWNAGIHGLEVLFGFPLSKWATGLVLLLAAITFRVFRQRRLAGDLAFVAGIQLATRLTAGVLKNVLPRARPFEVLASAALAASSR